MRISPIKMVRAGFTKKRSFTLLEMMVSIALLTLVAGGIGWKMHGLIEKRRFHTAFVLLQSQIQTVHRLALNRQADWEAVLEFKGGKCTFEARCVDPPGSKSMPPIVFHVSDALLDGKGFSFCKFLFSSSGNVQPLGIFHFRSKDQSEIKRVDLASVINKSQGDGVRTLGPIHPDEKATETFY